MSVGTAKPQLTERRGELLAELFFQELDPLFISRPTSEEVGYDLLVGFANDKAGVNTFAVQVKSTERPPGTHYPLQRSTFNRLAHSNVPGLLLVADVKQSRLHYAWLRSKEAAGRAATVSVHLKELDDKAKAEIRKQFRAAEAGVAAAG